MNSKNIVKYAVKHFLDAAENSAIEVALIREYKEKKEQSTLYELKLKYEITKRLIALMDIVDEVEQKSFVCKCGSTKFTMDCPAIVCELCQSIYYIKSEATIEYCNECTSIEECKNKYGVI